MTELDDIAAEINKVYGDGTLLRATDAKNLIVERLPTGIFDLDMKIGGGVPRGRITMFKGSFSSGKSAVCLRAASQAQQHCRLCGTRFEYVDLAGELHSSKCSCGACEPMRVVWLDVERSWDSNWSAKWGVDVANTYIIQTQFAEQAIDVADKVIRSRECDLLVIDSIAALTPSIEIEETSQNWQMGVLARLVNKALRKWTSALNSYSLLSATQCTILLINQMRMKIGGYRPTLTSPGGMGLDFFESVEVRFKRSDEVLDKGSGRPLGIEVEFAIKKNKTAPMVPGGLFKLFFVGQKGGYQIGDTNNDEQVLRAAGYWKIIHKGAGGWYTFPNGDKYRTTEVAGVLRTLPELYSDLESAVRLRELSWATTAQELETEKKNAKKASKKAEE